ncbi:hypothetical protein N0P75_05245 [Citrobacter youngae]|uniref:hypothetical protein n=1 Tax=Citrobacter youngae TaxID=133448 RepID=UPI003F198AB9
MDSGGCNRGNASTYAYAYADAYTYTATATAGSATAEGNTLTGITAGENSTLSGGMAQSQAVNAWTLGDATGGAAYASAYAYARAYAYAYTSTATAGSATAEGNTLTGITAGENSTLSGGMAQSQAVNAWTLGDATGGSLRQRLRLRPRH